LLPCFFVHGEPVSGDFPVKVPIADGRLFEAHPQGFRAPVRDKVLHGLIDETAAFAWSGYPVDRLNCRLGQHNVDAFSHAAEG
jgi:hypothetical protein